jgi:hypothetical protein
MFETEWRGSSYFSVFVDEGKVFAMTETAWTMEDGSHSRDRAKMRDFFGRDEGEEFLDRIFLPRTNTQKERSRAVATFEDRVFSGVLLRKVRVYMR